MNKKYLMLLPVIVAVVVGISAVADDSKYVSTVSPEPPSITLDSHGNDVTLQSAKMEKGFVADAKSDLPGLSMSSVKVSEHATYVYYSPPELFVSDEITLTDFVKNGGIMIETYDQSEESKQKQLEKVRNAGLDHVRHFEIQGQPAYGYPMDGITPTLLKIFPKGTDKRITLASGGTVDELVSIAEKINLS